MIRVAVNGTPETARRFVENLRERAAGRTAAVASAPLVTLADNAALNAFLAGRDR